MENNNSICTYRWSYPIYYMFDQSFAYCCRTPAQYIAPPNIEKYQSDVFSKMDYFQERRSEMLNGVKHSDCISCWKLEDEGVQSPRIYSNFEYQMQKSGVLSKQETWKDIYKNEHLRKKVESESAVDILEIVLSNTCNAKCIYCNEFYSTSWLQEKKRTLSVSSTYFDKIRNEKIDQLFWSWFEKKAISTVNRIGFIGGEPLVIPELYECLSKIDDITQQVSNFSGKPEICITTNLSISAHFVEKFLALAAKLSPKFKFVIQLSIESPPEQTEYIRHGTDWNLIEKNIEKLLTNKNIEIDFAVLPTMNVLAVPTIASFLKLVVELHKKYRQDIKVLSNTVTDPSMLNPTILSKREAAYISSAIDFIDEVVRSKEVSNDQGKYFDEYKKYLFNLKNILEQKENPDRHQIQLLHLFLQKNDLLRKVDYKPLFPAIHNIIERGAYD